MVAPERETEGSGTRIAAKECGEKRAETWVRFVVPKNGITTPGFLLNLRLLPRKDQVKARTRTIPIRCDIIYDRRKHIPSVERSGPRILVDGRRETENMRAFYGAGGRMATGIPWAVGTHGPVKELRRIIHVIFASDADADADGMARHHSWIRHDGEEKSIPDYTI
ncbi:hypothetical protein ACLOJK_030745 [Asimina triloba]